MEKLKERIVNKEKSLSKIIAPKDANSFNKEMILKGIIHQDR